MSIRNRMTYLCDIICTNQKEKNKRFEDLFEFMTWAIKNIPLDIRNQLGSSSDIVLTRRDGVGYVELSLQDYNWWKQFYANHRFCTIKPIKEIEKEFMNKILALATTNEYIEKKEQLEEIIAQINEIYADEN